MKTPRSPSRQRPKLILLSIILIIIAYVFFVIAYTYGFPRLSPSESFPRLSFTKHIKDCDCPIDDGIMENFCYSPYGNDAIRGKRFNCDHAQTLKRLDLLSPRDNPVDLDLLDFSAIVIAASSSHFPQSARLMVQLRILYPDMKIIFYDLGLDAEQRDKLMTVCGIETRFFDFSLYPSYVKRLKEFRWKPLIIAEVLREYDSVWYLDSSVIPKHGHMENVSELVKCRAHLTSTTIPSPRERDDREANSVLESGFNQTVFSMNMRECVKSALLLHGFSGHGIFSATSPVMYEFLPTDMREIRKERAKMYDAGVMFIVRTSEVVRDVIKWLVLCALEEDCMAPVDAGAYCFFDEDDKYTKYADCHRFDQSALNVLLANANHYDRHYYVSEIVDFFTIQRELDNDAEVNLSGLGCAKPILVGNI